MEEEIIDGIKRKKGERGRLNLESWSKNDHFV
jgi:hypothetical protein